MRTKTLLLTAALGAASIATSMAQVYSVNIVGYINLTIPDGLSLVANQLNGTPNNTVLSVFGAAPASGFLTINKFNGRTYDQAIYINGLGWGAEASTMTMNPGEGVFVDNADVSFTTTLVGNVQLNSNLGIPPGLQVYSSVIPQQAPIDTIGFPLPTEDVFSVYLWNRSLVPQGYDTYVYIPGLGWGGPGGGTTAPSPRVGESFFVDNSSPTTTFRWIRNFPVGP